MIKVIRTARSNADLGLTQGMAYEAYIGASGRYYVINENGDRLGYSPEYMNGEYFSVVSGRPKIGGI